jgi:multimeric flavodoxin WrbA
MKAIAINASQMMDKGNTAAILSPFLDGMREVGAEVEVFYTKQLDIKPCQAEFTCQLKTPGKCFQKDDMEMLLPKLAEADIHIFATPVYVDGIAGSLKTLWERTVPLANPLFELRDGHCYKRRRKDSDTGKVVLVSSCGYWEMDNFDPMLAHVKARCRNINREFAGALLRPHSAALKIMASRGSSINDIFAAAREAGYQLIKEGEMSSRTLAAIGRPLMPLEEYVQVMNQMYQDTIAAFGAHTSVHS